MAENEIAKLNDWGITKLDLDVLKEMISENVGASGLTLSDLDSVSVPAGGGTGPACVLAGVVGGQRRGFTPGLFQRGCNHRHR